MNFWSEIWATICSFFMQYVAEPIMNMGARDILDVLLLALVLYELFRFAKNRRAGRVTIGLLIVIFAMIAVQFLRFPALTYISKLFGAAVFFCIVVIYQPEIRDALERIGNSTFLNPRSDTISRKHLPLAKSTSEEITDAVFQMAEKRVGALIVMEGLTKLANLLLEREVIFTEDMENIFGPRKPKDGEVKAEEAPSQVAASEETPAQETAAEETSPVEA